MRTGSRGMRTGSGKALRDAALCTGACRGPRRAGVRPCGRIAQVLAWVPMHIEILCTGDEVLTGATVNTNFSHISQKLGDVGLSVRWGTTVGDDRGTLLEAFLIAGARADAVIVNGGLGPTVDDLSQEIAAKAAGVELVFNEGWYRRMEEFFTRRSRVMPASNRKQAMLP